MTPAETLMDALSSFPVVQNPRGAVIICPGGGYEMLADREAEPVAAAFADSGWQPFVLRYPIKEESGSAPLLSGPLKSLGRAVSIVRRKDFSSVVLCGFSAGGHLAASLGVHWPDLVDQFGDCRPDALILSYPVISMKSHFHEGSMLNLTGADPEWRDYFSLENQAGPDSVPAFLWHTCDDRDVPVENSLMFFSALRSAGVTSELHIFPRGEHGLSLATPEVDQPEKNRYADSHVAKWFSLSIGWLEEILGTPAGQ